MMSSVKGIASIVIIGVIVVGCLVAGIVSQKYLGPHNEVEVLAEDVIEKETGLKIDLDIPKKKQ